jgi:hypothetical protein
VRLITPIANRVFWDNQGAHSAVKVPSKPFALATEEIYGKGAVLTDAFGRALGGCPWGWARVVDISDETKLKIVAEVKVDENQASACSSVNPVADNYSSYASHNPTLTPDVALVTWHSGGLRAIDITDPAHPATGGFFLPAPELFSATQDPILENGSNNVIAWSYPIIKDGLIYYVDIRNGLYIVRYSGPHAQQVAGVKFLEGNSSLGDAAALEGTTAPAAAARLPILMPNTTAAEPAAAWVLGALLVAVVVGMARLEAHRRGRVP